MRLAQRLAVAALACLAGAAHAQSAAPIKVGIALDISGPFASLGADARDGFDLAIEKLGGTLGGQPAEFLKTDFAGSPEQATQLVNRYLQRDKIQFFTGPIASNSALAVAPLLFKAKVPFLSNNPGPSQFAGKQCNAYFFGQYQNDTYDEAAGKLANEKGYKYMVILAPNYPAGKDHLNGFKRLYQGDLKDEIYTKVGQIDYAAEIAQIRAAKPDAVFFFLPGGMGINFIKQYVAGGLKDIPLIAPGFSADQDVINAVGEDMIGLQNTAHWTHDLDLPANKAFVADFRKKYERYPTVYAAMAYDTIMAMDAAVKDAGGASDPDKLVQALAKPSFTSLRGDFTYGPNQYPIQDYYLRVVAKDADGKVTNKLVERILTRHQDAYVADCKR
ncbi:ABC transporter substrate binding protein [plant metagenome]|uniref:ABC transporter substrate binding protein n=1 Tax=plant metagenome TaxID=1297885 RepID=A0A484PG42_9ZZZZ